MHQCLSSLKKTHLRVATAESCTAGGIAVALTEVPGSSAWFDQGWVTYTAESKQAQLGVSQESIDGGVVSAAVAREMAVGALERADAEVALAVTGVAGPGGGEPEHPVGCCWFGVATKHDVLSVQALLSQVGSLGYTNPNTVKVMKFRTHTLTVRCDFPGTRGQIREAAVIFALDVLELVVPLVFGHQKPLLET